MASRPRLSTSLHAALCALLALGLAHGQSAEVPRATPVEAGSPASMTYKLMAQDVVSVVVFSEPELSVQARIDRDGAINMPLVGLVRIMGQNIREASRTIEGALREYLIKPQVSLTILVYTKRRITILGQVNKPGTLDLPDESSVDLMEAIGMAGGFSRIASDKITVTRTVGGQEQVLVLDSKAMRKDGSIKRFLVQPGDTISIGERLF